MIAFTVPERSRRDALASIVIVRNFGRAGKDKGTFSVAGKVQFDGMDVNTILQTVRSISGEGDVQLGILVYAAVIAAKSLGVPKHRLMAAVREAVKRDIQLVPLETNNN